MTHPRAAHNQTFTARQVDRAGGNSPRRAPREEIMSRSTSNEVRRAATSIALAVLAVSGSSARAIEQSGEQKNMKLVAHLGLQGRGSYQPNVITYPDGRTIIFAGTHAGSAPNPLNGGVVELNGTFI